MANLENIRKWHDGLVSGEWKQGRGVLGGNDDTYCCLGVACLLAGVVPVASEGYALLFDGQLSRLPLSVRSWLGLAQYDNAPILNIPTAMQTGGRVARSAILLNDSDYMTFGQIAACIRETWPEAFYDQKRDGDALADDGFVDGEDMGWFFTREARKYRSRK